MSRLRSEPWGTWCHTCRTVRIRGANVVCAGGSGVRPHPLTVIEVIP